jgi:hypothetical protein
MPSDAGARLRALYARVDAEVAARASFRCALSGRCCDFRGAGHELYVTTLEFREMLARGGRPDPGDGSRCPWLRNGLCGNRDGRALACRTYHCSDEMGAAQVTERWHGELRRLHEETGTPYAYRPLREFFSR